MKKTLLISCLTLAAAAQAFAQTGKEWNDPKTASVNRDY